MSDNQILNCTGHSACPVSCAALEPVAFLGWVCAQGNTPSVPHLIDALAYPTGLFRSPLAVQLVEIQVAKCNTEWPGRGLGYNGEGLCQSLSPSWACPILPPLILKHSPPSPSPSASWCKIHVCQWIGCSISRIG